MPSSQATAAPPEPARVEDFLGYEVWIDPDGRPMVTLFRGGHLTDLLPDDETAKQPPGFYSLDHSPIPKPI